MLAAVLLLPLLRVALAEDAPCPCPPTSPEDFSVCGSDSRTYSECELKCAVRDQPGLFAAHPGQCAPPEAAAGRHRRYTVEYPEWSKCFDDRQCGLPLRGDCDGCCNLNRNTWCNKMCGWNCACRCAGLPTVHRSKDSYERFDNCYQDRGCESEMKKCKKRCGFEIESCREDCEMDHMRCGCGCVRHIL